ncbi:D-alanyl-D-alanine carboxypeptidase family protein [Brevibacillus daliensis]|uniref:D-alanyl-D-alanine carboxypeptidase family protein n=1 Tax=Brevibacillus daliensis TaxID=2892995 RepID=UPI001E2F9255|nr:D-alanyl-D-alanine carboxypeptidase family protein [Brevibacillus daliensis]
MKYQSKPIGVLVVFFLCMATLSPTSNIEAAPSDSPSISAESAAVIDVASGRILFEKNGHKQMRIASLTKTLTAITAIESSDINQMVTVPDQAVGVEGSSIFLKRGEKLTLEQLLYGLMLRSGNDAATAIAMQVGGSTQGFATMMNEKASFIGMTESNFTNPHGLDDSDEHYSTAIDMVKLSAYALKNPAFQQIVSTKVKNIPWDGEKWERRLQNKNKMLHLYKGADGVKTGFTKKARRCLASSATRDGRQLAVITLNASDDWKDHANLLDFGFQQYSEHTLLEKGKSWSLPDHLKNKENKDWILTVQDSFRYPLQAGEEQHVRTKWNVTLPLKKSSLNQQAGFIELYLHDDLIGKMPVTLQQAKDTFQQFDEPSSSWKNVMQWLRGGAKSA